MPSMVLAEVEVQLKQQDDDDAHLELLWALHFPRSDFPASSYSVVAIAITECREWISARFIVRNE